MYKVETSLLRGHPLGLVQICTLSQGLQNLGEHVMSGIHKMLRDFIMDKNMDFLDDFL